MFGLTRREQRWKADQKAAETLVELARVVVDAQAISAKVDAEELARLRAAEADFHMEYRLKCDAENIAQTHEIERLRAAIKAAVPAMREYARKNPKHHFGERLQDPNGVHAWLEEVGSWQAQETTK
jgi:hypothetical protein